MSKNAWIVLTVVIAAAAGGGAYYVVHQQTMELPAQPEAGTPAPTMDVQRHPSEDVTKKKIEGIGSTRALTPVPIPQGPAK